MLALSLKPEWRMTAQESVNNRIAELNELRRSLWRKRDFPDLKGIEPKRLRAIHRLHERVIELEQTPVKAVIQARKFTILRAIKRGRPIPLKVLREYMDVKHFGNARSIRFGPPRGIRH